jgi:hypothetical protein
LVVEDSAGTKCVPKQQIKVTNAVKEKSRDGDKLLEKQGSQRLGIQGRVVTGMYATKERH